MENSFNVHANSYLELLSEDEKKIALSMLKSMDGIKVEKARWMLEFCKAAISTKAVVTFSY